MKTTVDVDLRYWNHYQGEACWFRAQTGQGFAAIVWREVNWWTNLRLYPSVVEPDGRWKDVLCYEDDRGFAIADHMMCENTGRPSWREAAITRRADGLTEDFMHEDDCYSW